LDPGPVRADLLLSALFPWANGLLELVEVCFVHRVFRGCGTGAGGTGRPKGRAGGAAGFQRCEAGFDLGLFSEVFQLVEAKLTDDTFSKSLSHFQRFVPGAEAIQVVRTLGRAKSDPGRKMRMVPAADYLAKLSLRPAP
jgi:hypothetical protein